MDPDNEPDMIYLPIPNEKLLIKDLELHNLFINMSRRDSFIQKVIKQTLLEQKTSLRTIIHRQGVLKDCLENSDVKRQFMIFQA